MAAIFGIPEIKARKLLGITQTISFWVAYIRIFCAHDMSSERDTFGGFIIISCFGGAVFDYKTLPFLRLAQKNMFASNAFLLREPVS